MKINLPVTNIETLLPEGEFIYSRTDLKGVITEANEAFCVSAAIRATRWSGSRTTSCATRTCLPPHSRICGAT